MKRRAWARASRRRHGACNPLFGYERGLALSETLQQLDDMLRHDVRDGWVTFTAWASRLGYDDLRGCTEAGVTLAARRRWQRLMGRLREAGVDLELPVNDGHARASFRLTPDGRDRYVALRSAHLKWLAARAS